MTCFEEIADEILKEMASNTEIESKRKYILYKLVSLSMNTMHDLNVQRQAWRHAEQIHTKS